MRHGLPVLAMQYPISDRVAIEFTAGSYGAAFSSDLPIEAAVAEARKALSLALPGSMDWGTPVLPCGCRVGSRSRSGRPNAATLTPTFPSPIHPPSRSPRRRARCTARQR